MSKLNRKFKLKTGLKSGSLYSDGHSFKKACKNLGGTQEGGGTGFTCDIGGTIFFPKDTVYDDGALILPDTGKIKRDCEDAGGAFSSSGTSKSCELDGHTYGLSGFSMSRVLPGVTARLACEGAGGTLTEGNTCTLSDGTTEASTAMLLGEAPGVFHPTQNFSLPFGAGDFPSEVCEAAGGVFNKNEDGSERWCDLPDVGTRYIIGFRFD